MCMVSICSSQVFKKSLDIDLMSKMDLAISIRNMIITICIIMLFVFICKIGTNLTRTHILFNSVFYPLTFALPLEPKAAEEMKGTDQEYSSALTQYNSSANSGGEDIELLAFQTVTGQNIPANTIC